MRTLNDKRFRRPVGSRLPLRTLAIALALLALFAAVVLWRGPLGGAAAGAEDSVHAARGGFSGWVGNLGSLFASKASLVRENDALKAQLSHAEVLLADREALARENEDLKARLGREDAREVVLAGVIGRPPGIPYDTLLIDAGAEEGIAVGDVVSAGGGTAVGTITEVFATRARAALHSSPGTSYQALLRGSVEFTVEGNGGGSFSGKIPSATPAAAGDTVLLPGIEGGFMGRVSGIYAPEGDSSKTLHFHLPVNLFELQFVEVWK